MIDTRFYHFHGSLNLSDIIRELQPGAEVSSNNDVKINTVTNLDKCTENALSFYSGKKYKAALASARGGVILCRAEDKQAILDAGCMAVVSKHPRADFSRLLRKIFSKLDFQPGDAQISAQAQVSQTAQIMPGAVIGANAVIHDNVKIGPNAVIGPGVTIGANSSIGPCAQIFCADIGERCIIHGGAVIGGDGFGVAQNDAGNVDIFHVGTVIIEQDVAIGHNTTIDRGMLGATRIGKRTKIDNICQIGHNTQIGEDCVFAAHTGISGSCIIGDGVAFGGAVGIADHVTIGDGAILAARSGVMKNVPAGEVWSGYPAKPLRQHMREVATLSRLARRKKT